MSDKPLARASDGTYVIILSYNAEEAQRVLNMYGMDATLDRVVTVLDVDGANLAAITYAGDTKWCMTETAGYNPTMENCAAILRRAFGDRVTQAAAFAALNQEYAINPKTYRP